jgi:pyridoxamine 5'-phosphate oxidase family protein
VTYPRSRLARWRLDISGRVAFVVDDIASVQPWRVRCVEIRGHAEALRDQEPLMPGMSREIIRIHPERVISFGLENAPG